MNQHADRSRPRLCGRKIYDALHQERVKRGLTWEEVQAELGMGGGSFGSRMARIKRNDMLPRANTLFRICLWTGKEIRDFAKES